MKKALTLLLACALLLGVNPALAIDAPIETTELPIEFGPHPGVENVTQFSENDTNFDAVIDAMIENRIRTYEPNETDRQKAYEIMQIYDAVVLESNGADAATQSSFDDNWWKLRYGNLIEVTLDYDEGVTNAQVLKTISLSRDAESDAADNFPLYQDAGQHFIWNFMMTDTYTKAKARTIANNHEWGIAMITPMLNHYESTYDEYIEAGYSEDDASDNALADTIVYMPIFKYDAVCVSEASYAFFDYFFSDESIMDFWNNCYGRSYPEKGYTSGVSAFRYSGLIINELVLDGPTSMTQYLTEDHKKSIWEWDWYSY